jgi:hypothetical protein
MWVEKEGCMGVLTLDLSETKLGLSVDKRINLDGSGVPLEPLRVILNVDRNFYRFLLTTHSRWILYKNLSYIVDEIFFEYHIHVSIDECVPHILGVMGILGAMIADRIKGEFVWWYGWTSYVRLKGKNVLKMFVLDPDFCRGGILVEFLNLESNEIESILNYFAWLYRIYNGEVTTPPLEEWYGIVKYLLGDD